MSNCYYYDTTNMIYYQEFEDFKFGFIALTIQVFVRLFSIIPNEISSQSK